jgi:hypothetical protein
MRRRGREHARLTVLEGLEARWLLATRQLPGNAGAIVASQYQPSGSVTKVGAQLREVELGGPSPSTCSALPPPPRMWASRLILSTQGSSR